MSISKNHQYTLWLLLIFSGGFCSAPANATGIEMEWCLDHLPPRQSYFPGQLPTGPMVDMMQKLAKQSGFTLTFSPPPPTARCLKLMQQGKTDLMAGLLWSEKRQQYMLLLPFDEAKPEALFVHKDHPIPVASALQNRHIVLAKNRLYSKGFVAFLQQHQVKTHRTADLEQAMAMLHFKQVDAVVGPEHISEQILKNNPRLRASIILNPWQADTSLEHHAHLALSRQSPHFHLHLKIRQQLEKLVAANETRFYQ